MKASALSAPTMNWINTETLIEAAEEEGDEAQLLSMIIAAPLANVTLDMLTISDVGFELAWTVPEMSM